MIERMKAMRKAFSLFYPLFIETFTNTLRWEWNLRCGANGRRRMASNGRSIGNRSHTHNLCQTADDAKVIYLPVSRWRSVSCTFTIIMKFHNRNRLLFSTLSVFYTLQHRKVTEIIESNFSCYKFHVKNLAHLIFRKRDSR